MLLLIFNEDGGELVPGLLVVVEVVDAERDELSFLNRGKSMYENTPSSPSGGADPSETPSDRSATAILMPWSKALASSVRSNVRPYLLSSVFQWCHFGFGFVYCMSFFNLQSRMTALSDILTP